MLALGLGFLWGCVPEGKVNARGELQGYGAQKYPLGEVMDRAEKLRPGMSKTRVLILLGSPAYDDYRTWRYVQDRPGVLVPGKELIVRFEGHVYQGHDVVPVVLGEALD